MKAPELEFELHAAPVAEVVERVDAEQRREEVALDEVRLEVERGRQERLQAALGGVTDDLIDEAANGGSAAHESPPARAIRSAVQVR